MDKDKIDDFHHRVKDLRDEVRMHATQTEDPQCATFCDTVGEVLAGLEESFDHYLEKTE